MASLVEQLIAGLREHPWPDYMLQSKSVEDIVASVADVLVPCVGGSLRDSGAVAEGRSKVGGLPDLPGSVAWPTERGRPLAFVCQVNLAEAGPHSDGALPTEGMLYLFSIYDADRAYGYEIVEDETARVIWCPKPGEVSAAAAPEGLRSEGIFEERGVQWGRSVTLERITEGVPSGATVDYSVVKVINELVLASGGQPAQLRMLGHAHFFREENIEEYDAGLERLLLELSGYTVAKSAFGEGDFHLTIGADDLASASLEKNTLVFEVGT